MRKELQNKVDFAFLSLFKPLKAESGRVNHFYSKGG